MRTTKRHPDTPLIRRLCFPAGRNCMASPASVSGLVRSTRGVVLLLININGAEFSFFSFETEKKTHPSLGLEKCSLFAGGLSGSWRFNSSVTKLFRIFKCPYSAGHEGRLSQSISIVFVITSLPARSFTTDLTA